MRGRKPKPTVIRKAGGDPGKRAFNPHEPRPLGGKPSCPPHLSTVAKTEWKRICGILYDMGVITQIDRAVLAGYCQAYARWAEAERKLKEGPTSALQAYTSPDLDLTAIATNPSKTLQHTLAFATAAPAN
jgi:P27 family predicted phage terminase small subunit